MVKAKIPFAAKKCKELPPGTPALTGKQVKTGLSQLTGWKEGDKQISKAFKFDNYHHTMAFVNATAWVSHLQNHHPDLEVGYDYCLVTYSTHSVGGLSENDFICAAKIDALSTT